jgi:hypothetical protein
MDTDEGDDQNPLTLHKYLYANADPADGRDPSGHEDTDMASLGTAEAMSNTLNAMAQLQPCHGIDRFGVGIEVPKSSAVQNGVLNVASNPGHAFAYLRDSTGKVVSVLSFGPKLSIMWNPRLFTSGKMPGNAHYPIDENVSTWESRILAPQLQHGEDVIAAFKKNVPNYTWSTQCTSVTISIAQQTGITLPDGVGPVVAEGGVIEVARESVPNPYKLSEQMKALYGPPQVVSPSAFPNP